MIKKALYLVVAKVALIVGAVLGMGLLIYKVVMNWDMSLLKMPDPNPLSKFNENVLQKLDPTESLTRMIDMNPQPKKQELFKIPTNLKIHQLPNYTKEIPKVTKYKVPKYKKPKNIKIPKW